MPNRFLYRRRSMKNNYSIHPAVRRKPTTPNEEKHTKANPAFQSTIPSPPKKISIYVDQQMPTKHRQLQSLTQKYNKKIPHFKQQTKHISASTTAPNSPELSFPGGKVDCFNPSLGGQMKQKLSGLNRSIRG